jgi:hypothetical protein
MHVWLMKYTTSLEAESKRAKGTAWRERYLTERASTGREKKGLPGVISHEGIEDAVNAPAEPEDVARLSFLNLQLNGAGTVAPAETDWNSVVAAGIEQTRVNQDIRGQQKKLLEEWYASDKDETDILTDEQQADEAEEQMWLESRKLHYLSILPGATEENLHDRAVAFLAYMTDSEEEELAAWAMRAGKTVTSGMPEIPCRAVRLISCMSRILISHLGKCPGRLASVYAGGRNPMEH